MGDRLGELTTADSWDQLWKSHKPTSSGDARGRRYLKMYRDFEGLQGRLLDADGPGKRDVLELGCAPGAMLAQLHRLRPQHVYRGLDFAPQGLEVAQNRLAAVGMIAELNLGDMRTAVLEPADLVVSFGLIEHFDDPAEAMRHHRRFVKPGGMTAVTVPNYSHPFVVRLLRNFSPATLATHNLQIMNPTAMATALELAGFTNVRAGYSGVASLPSSRVRPDLRGRAFGLSARAWNTLAGAFPAERPWANHVWATGRNPGM